jgi:hypothetical protein
VFGTSEFPIIPPFYLAGQPDIARLAQESSFFVWGAVALVGVRLPAAGCGGSRWR